MTGETGPGTASANLPAQMRVEPAPRALSIVVACSRVPLPMTRADQMTVAHLIEFLARRGHRIDLFALDTGETLTDVQRAWLEERCRTLRLFPHGRVRSVAGVLRGLARGLPLQVGWFLNGAQIIAVREAMPGADIGYAYYIRSAETLRGLHPNGVTFLAMQLSQALNTRRMAANYRNIRERLIYAVESRLVRPYEARIWRDFTRTVLIGWQDVTEIRAACRERGLAEIDNMVFGPHGVDTGRFAPRPDIAPAPCSLVFNGVLRTYTNVHAITWFARHVWPKVKQEEPAATLTIVGRDPRAEVRALARLDGVTVTGEVRDPADWLARAAVCIDPVEAGAGMQNKLIEYMAMGKPVVATTVANEGIGATPGEHLVLADEPDAMAREILALFGDAGRRAGIGQAARAFVVRNWTWEALFLRLEKAMFEALGDK